MEKVFIVCLILISYTKLELIVRGPKKLRDFLGNSTIETSISNFGRIPYGYNIIGKLHFDPDNKDKERACKPISMPSVTPESEVDESPIIMIDR